MARGWGLTLFTLAAGAATALGLNTVFDAPKDGGVPVEVNVTQGMIIGRKFATHQAFKGIPYGAPPQGALRWKAPQPAKGWKEPLEAVKFGNACPQICHQPAMTCPNTQPFDPDTYSEDCLFLNVWSPVHATEKGPKLPVMFWIHGGRYRVESGGEILYSGDAISNFTDHIHVTVNYRLGALGFMVHPDVEESKDGGAGFGIMDQRLAMKWVRDNIHAFGGDKNRITVYGQSAGGMSLAVHMVTPQSAGLFQAAISESNPAAIEYKDVHEASKFGEQLSHLLNCGRRGSGVAACLATKTFKEIVEAQVKVHKHFIPFPHTIRHSVPWSPTINFKEDGLLANPLTMMANGVTQKVPIIYGFLSEDARPFGYETFPKPLSKDEYEAVILGDFGPIHGAEIMGKYPVAHEDRHDVRGNTLQNVLTDYIFACSQRHMALGALKGGAQPFMYNYTHALECCPGAWGPNFTFCEGHVCHGSELPILFASANLIGKKYHLTPGETVLSHEMQNYWTILLAQGMSGKLTGQGGDWAGLSEGVAPLMQLGIGSLQVNTGKFDETCKFWDRIGYLKA